MIDIDSLNLRRSDRHRDIAIAGSERDVCLVRNEQVCWIWYCKSPKLAAEVLTGSFVATGRQLAWVGSTELGDVCFRA